MYFSRASGLKQQLEGSGVNVKMSDFKLQLLAGLPDVYAPVVEVISDWVPDDANKSVAEMLARLQVTEARLNKKPKSDTNALMVYDNKPKAKLKCTYCKRTGHVIQDCCKKTADDSGKYCTFCNKPGHETEVCYAKRAAERRTAGPSDSAQVAYAMTACAMTDNICCNRGRDVYSVLTQARRNT
jgi:hypothetical protein